AADLAEVLSEIFNVRAARVGAPSLLAPGHEAVELRSTRGFDFGATGVGNEPFSGEADLAASPRAGGPLGSPMAAGAGTKQPEVRIIAYDSTNSLVISALPRDYQRIREAIEKLDSLPLQVLIEATIAEVTLSDE